MRLTLDWPPLWLAAFAGLAWAQAQLWPPGGLPGAVRTAGSVLVAAGVLLMLAAAVEFRRHRTTILPHGMPRALVTTGVYRFTRNPIYLADVVILAGLVLRWDALPSLLLVPLLAAVLHRRFVRPEEARLRAAFGPAFEAWAARTRAWI